MMLVNTQKNELYPHWIIVVCMVISLLAYVAICQWFGHELQEPLPEERREFIRTIFYVIAIVLMPLTNLIRHIQLKLNQTMPGNKTAKSRYLLTVIVSMLLMESIGVLGFVMYMLGDDFNTLYIFTGLSLLGVYLYRPKEDEYDQIVNELNNE
jgi:putative Ca2+/H+ antiporter (TMEM165/GDT1 family)